MVILRFLLLAFNVAVAIFLIYHMLEVARKPMSRSKKATIITGGILLLLAPCGMFIGFFVVTPQYFIIYPVALWLFIYLTKKL